MADEAAAQRFAELESAALQNMRHVVVTSATTGRALIERYLVSPNKIVCARPGTDKHAVVAGGRECAQALLSVGAVIPRKGHDVLVAAMARLRHLSWSLTIIGNTTRNPGHAADVKRLIANTGLAQRVVVTGELATSVVETHWRKTDIFVAASRHEGYGMAVAEAIARGIPVVTTTAGAVGEWLSREAALVVPNGDVNRLADAIGLLLEDRGRQQTLRDGALQLRRILPDWAETARIVSTALELDRP